MSLYDSIFGRRGHQYVVVFNPDWGEYAYAAIRIDHTTEDDDVRYGPDTYDVCEAIAREKNSLRNRR